MELDTEVKKEIMKEEEKHIEDEERENGEESTSLLNMEQWDEIG